MSSPYLLPLLLRSFYKSPAPNVDHGKGFWVVILFLTFLFLSSYSCLKTLTYEAINFPLIFHKFGCILFPLIYHSIFFLWFCMLLINAFIRVLLNFTYFIFLCNLPDWFISKFHCNQMEDLVSILISVNLTYNKNKSKNFIAGSNHIFFEML